MFLSIDIAKTTFDAALLPATASAHTKPRHKVFTNTPADFEQLTLWLRQNLAAAGTVHACLEATGTYGEALALYLREVGHVVSVVNPAQIKAFGQS